jgi:hypothetical protein
MKCKQQEALYPPSVIEDNPDAPFRLLLPTISRILLSPSLLIVSPLPRTHSHSHIIPLIVILNLRPIFSSLQGVFNRDDVQRL